MKFKKENRNFDLKGLERGNEQVVKKCEKQKQELEDFKNDIKRLLWFDIVLTNEETQYLLQKSDETYGEYNE
jgi:hypothetical protein